MISTVVSLIALSQTKANIDIIPKPLKTVVLEGKFVLKADTSIVASKETAALARQLQNDLNPSTGYDLPIRGRAGDNTIELRIDRKLKDLGEEGYQLEVSPKQVVIRAPHAAGVFYGIQSLRQLFPAQSLRKAKVEGQEWSAPCVKIEDKPRFGWRGNMVDTGRFFMPKSWILKHIDSLALHKMNVLHLHLTEDQGWRIEIKRYPKLTSVGGYRKETMAGHYNEGRYDGKPHGGFYTQDDIREIVAYAKARFVNVVPEIEMPGHAQAAIAAYPELGNTGKQLDVSTHWGVHEDVFNVDDSTIKFLQNVLDEVIELFPSKFIHIGGDECPKRQWKESEKVQAKMKSLGLKDEHEMQSWFIKQMDSYLASKGRRLIGWDEILEGGLAPGAAVMSWRGEAGGIAAAKAGHEVVMAPTTYTYLDFYQARPTNLEPTAIGGYLPLEAVYNYNPIPKELTAEEGKKVLGPSAQLWSEYMPNSRHMEFMAFPRLCALSEVAWSPNDQKDFADFKQRLSTHLKRLDVLDVNYRKEQASPFQKSVGSWKSGQVTSEASVQTWDLGGAVGGPGKYEVTFSYASGEHRLDIEWVELLEDGNPVARDEHAGFTGGAEKLNTYLLEVKTATAGKKYTLRAKVRADGGNDSNGNIFISRK